MLLQSRQKMEFNVLDSPNLLIEVLFDPVHSLTTHINTKMKSTKISTKFRKKRNVVTVGCKSLLRLRAQSIMENVVLAVKNVH